MVPGMRFMYVGDNDNNFLPTFKNMTNGRETDESKVIHQVFTFIGTDEVQPSNYSFSTRFKFMGADSAQYFYEVKDKHLAQICSSNARAYISRLAYVNDVDSARVALLGRLLYTKLDNAFVDMPGGGTQQVKLPVNSEVKVTAIGVGTRECPVKIIFEDKDGKSYYREVAFSGTNSGLLKSDFVGANLTKYFPNVFALNNRELLSAEALKTKYVGQPVYPKTDITATQNGVQRQLRRYSQYTISAAQLGNGTKATFTLRGIDGGVYDVAVDTRYNIVIKNTDYVNDLFGFDNLRKRYPYITEEHWELLSRGEVAKGMTKDECRLAMGPAVQIVSNTNNYETWYYAGRTLDFEGNVLLRIK
jgi:hypothetical protein